MTLVTGLLIQNEADRLLARVLENALSFSDRVLVLDDRSTDASAKIAQDLGCEVKSRSILKNPAWGDESPARAELWDWAAREAGDGWVLIQDGDQILHGNPKDLTWSTEVNSWAFILYDCWSETQYRADGFWQAHRHPRPWMVRPKGLGEGFIPHWNGRGVHVGHLPPNATLTCGIAPPDEYYWLHLGYSRPEWREAKYRRYEAVKPQLTPQEWAHSQSIIDP